MELTQRAPVFGLLGLLLALGVYLHVVALPAGIGMKASTKSNVRTTEAARAVGRDKALAAAFYGGSVMGLTIASLGILGLGLFFLRWQDPVVISGFAMGASSIALFARVG